MNQKLADAAKAAMLDKSIEAAPRMCSKFVRQVVAKVYGSKYPLGTFFGATAIETGNLFLKRGLAFKPGADYVPEPGDILFKMSGSGDNGHVGICVGGGRVAENSSTPIGRVSGAKGFRSLSQFGRFDLVGRLPELKPPQYHPITIMAHGDKMDGLYDAERARVYVGVRDAFSISEYKWSDPDTLVLTLD